MEGGRLVVPVIRVVVRLPGVELVIVHGGRLQIVVLLQSSSTASADARH